MAAAAGCLDGVVDSNTSRLRRSGTAIAGSTGAALLLLGCTGSPEPGVVSPSPTASATSAASPAEPWDGAVTADVEVVAEELPVPWGLAPLPGGRFLVTMRDDATLAVVHPAGDVEPLVESGGAQQLADQTVADGEGGLLGVAVDPDDAGPLFTVYLYRTGEQDNAVLRAELDLDNLTLGDLTTVLDGIPKASNHNGGRIALGPDGYLYVATGDAGDTANAQDPESLAGKILRITPDGEPAPGNPDAGSPVWSMGHRNVQGLGWDPSGRMFAGEFGQDELDELNVIEPGGNYGWPEVEGPGDEAGFTTRWRGGRRRRRRRRASPSPTRPCTWRPCGASACGACLCSGRRPRWRTARAPGSGSRRRCWRGSSAGCGRFMRGPTASSTC